MATASSGVGHNVVDKVEDILRCPVCLDTLEDPRVLPCQHSFCFECVEGCMAGREDVTCPVCKQETTLPGGAVGLPKDLKANQLKEIVTNHQSDSTAFPEIPGPIPSPDTPDVSGKHPDTSTSCSMCDDVLTDPVTLTCQHLMCQRCASFLLEASADLMLYCPSCSCQSEISSAHNSGTNSATNIISSITSPQDYVAYHDTVYAVPSPDVPDGSGEQLETLPSCSQCNDLLTEPVTLTCQHLMCQHCVSFLYGEQADLILNCPSCSSKTNISQQGEAGWTVDAVLGEQGEVSDVDLQIPLIEMHMESLYLSGYFKK